MITPSLYRSISYHPVKKLPQQAIPKEKSQNIPPSPSFEGHHKVSNDLLSLAMAGLTLFNGCAALTPNNTPPTVPEPLPSQTVLIDGEHKTHTITGQIEDNRDNQPEQFVLKLIDTNSPNTVLINPDIDGTRNDRVVINLPGAIIPDSLDYDEDERILTINNTDIHVGETVCTVAIPSLERINLDDYKNSIQHRSEDSQEKLLKEARYLKELETFLLKKETSPQTLSDETKEMINDFIETTIPPFNLILDVLDGKKAEKEAEYIEKLKQYKPLLEKVNNNEILSEQEREEHSAFYRTFQTYKFLQNLDFSNLSAEQKIEAANVTKQAIQQREALQQKLTDNIPLSEEDRAIIATFFETRASMVSLLSKDIYIDTCDTVLPAKASQMIDARTANPDQLLNDLKVLYTDPEGRKMIDQLIDNDVKILVLPENTTDVEITGRSHFASQNNAYTWVIDNSSNLSSEDMMKELRDITNFKLNPELLQKALDSLEVSEKLSPEIEKEVKTFLESFPDKLIVLDDIADLGLLVHETGHALTGIPDTKKEYTVLGKTFRVIRPSRQNNGNSYFEEANNNLLEAEIKKRLQGVTLTREDAREVMKNTLYSTLSDWRYDGNPFDNNFLQDLENWTSIAIENKFTVEEFKEMYQEIKIEDVDRNLIPTETIDAIDAQLGLREASK